MNVRCSQCTTVFRVDPRKVPPQGVRARCSVCRGVFPVGATRDATPEPVLAGVPAPAAAEPTPEPNAAPVPPAPSLPATPSADLAGSAGGAEPLSSLFAPPAAPPEPPAPQPLVVGPSPPAAAPTARPATGARFGGQDPHAKARRLARALVSDMVTYHPDRQKRGLREGTLRKEFKEEIRKSWEEFVDQVGHETAHGTPFFRDALNEILARGQKIF
jgi:predicted Zn finger-like uncharacterized protein